MYLLQLLTEPGGAPVLEAGPFATQSLAQGWAWRCGGRLGIDILEDPICRCLLAPEDMETLLRPLGQMVTIDIASGDVIANLELASDPEVRVPTVATLTRVVELAAGMRFRAL